MNPIELPAVGDVIEAGVAFGGGEGKRARCTVTRVTHHEIAGHEPFVAVVGRWETQAGGWSRKQVVLRRPFHRLVERRVADRRVAPPLDLHNLQERRERRRRRS